MKKGPQPAEMEREILNAAFDFYQEYDWLYRAYIDNMEAMPQLGEEPRFKLLDATAKFLKRYGTER